MATQRAPFRTRRSSVSTPTVRFLPKATKLPACRQFPRDIDPLFFNDRCYSYNFAPVNYLQLPLERASAFARAGFEFSEAAELYAQGLYADYTADSQLAPTATFFGVLMPPTNPFIPPDLQLLLDSRDEPTSRFWLGNA